MFQRAVREQIKIKLGVSGPSGSGKTLSSLLLAKGLGGRVAIVDTENKSSSHYTDVIIEGKRHEIDFDICQLAEPYTSRKFIDALDYAIRAGYKTVIIDSISHQWAGASGILERKTIKDSIGGSGFHNWKDFTAEHNAFIAAILNAKANVICTMRSKADYIMEANDKGKQAPKKVGLAPIQREGFEYELDIVFDLAQNHIASVSKDRTGLFDGKLFKITEDTGKEISRYINSGAEIKKSLKDTILEKTVKILDEATKNKIIDTVKNENDETILSKYNARIDEIINDQAK